MEWKSEKTSHARKFFKDAYSSDKKKEVAKKMSKREKFAGINAEARAYRKEVHAKFGKTKMTGPGRFIS